MNVLIFYNYNFGIEDVKECFEKKGYKFKVVWSEQLNQRKCTELDDIFEKEFDEGVDGRSDGDLCERVWKDGNRGWMRGAGADGASVCPFIIAVFRTGGTRVCDELSAERDGAGEEGADV